MTREQYLEVLRKYLPQSTTETIYRWIAENRVELKIATGRSTKLGDYRAPHAGKGHRISINHDLNQYSFLITLVHEFAHLHTWERFGRRVKPHGLEWKLEFQRLMKPFLEGNVFPPDVLRVLTVYMSNPAASSCTDTSLLKVLKQYDPDSSTWLLEDLPPRSLFRLGKDRIFSKGEKLRKRYKCLEINTKKVYFVSPVAEVIPIREIDA